MCKRNYLICIANIGLPLLIGAVIYIMLSEDLLFMKWLFNDISLCDSFHIDMSQNKILQIIRFYIPDMLWSYSLFFGILFTLKIKASNRLTAFVIGIAFISIMEFIQIHPSVSGTFDVMDLIVEIIAIAVAVFVAEKTLFKEDLKNEKVG